MNELKEGAETYHKIMMAIDTTAYAAGRIGAKRTNEPLDVRLVNDNIYVVQKQTRKDQVILNWFGTVVNGLGIRANPYLTQIVWTILWRVNDRDARVGQQTADLATRLIFPIKQCGEDQLPRKLRLVLKVRHWIQARSMRSSVKRSL